MKKFIIGLVLGLFLVTGVFSSFFDSIINTISPRKITNGVSNKDMIYKTILLTNTGYTFTGGVYTLYTGSAVACFNCSGKNYLDSVTSIGTTLGTTTFTNGFQQSVGSGLAWDDVPNNQLFDGNTAIQKLTWTNLTGSTIQVRCFDGGTQMNEIFGKVEYVHDAFTGGVYSPHIHRLGTTTSATTTGIILLERQWLKFGVVAGGVGSTGSTTFTRLGFTGNLYSINDFLADISLSGYNLGDSLTYRMSRTPTGTDTYAGSICMIDNGFHYQRDTLGSRGEYNK